MSNYNYNNYPNPYQTAYPNPYQQRINQYAFVNGIEGAKSYQVMPNQTMLLMDSDNPICYMKVSDNLGKSYLRYFKLEEMDETKTKEFLEQTHTQNVPEYALKSDINALNTKLEELTKLLKKSSKGE